MDPENAERYPCAYADTGLSLFLQQAYDKGIQKSNLRIVLAGGAQTVDPPTFLNFGKRNLEAATKILNEHGLIFTATEVGGHATRTIGLNIGDGTIDLEVRGQGMRSL
jgi:chemotaxis protein CheD